jgi:hypothetical protein
MKAKITDVHIGNDFKVVHDPECKNWRFLVLQDNEGSKVQISKELVVNMLAYMAELMVYPK